MSSAKWSSRSPKSTSRFSPIETMAEKPMLRLLAHSASAVEIAPDCEIKARSPAFGSREAKLALSLMRGTRMPSEGPISRRPVSRAVWAMASVYEPVPRPRPAVSTIAVGQPCMAAAFTTRCTAGGGTEMMTRSGTCGRSRMWLKVLKPSISGYLRLTTWIGPRKPPSRKLRSVLPPTELDSGCRRPARWSAGRKDDRGDRCS